MLAALSLPQDEILFPPDVVFAEKIYQFKTIFVENPKKIGQILFQSVKCKAQIDL